MLVGKMSRETLVSCLPAGGRALEIGVAEGVFSSAILRSAKPSELHLIDPWVHQDLPEYQADANNVDNATNEQRHAAVLNKFKAEIEAGSVHVHRGFSKDVLPTFDDNTFDWVYVDAMHTRAAVLEDLRLVWPKIKPGGFVLGHDYTNSQQALSRGFGVVDAVRDFLKESGGFLVAMTMTVERFPSYILTRPGHQGINAFAKRFLLKAEAVVEIRSNSPDYQHKTVRVGDVTVSFPSF